MEFPWWYSSLRIYCCHWCGSGSCCGVNSNPSPETSICHGCSSQKEKNKKELYRLSTIYSVQCWIFLFFDFGFLLFFFSFLLFRVAPVAEGHSQARNRSYSCWSMPQSQQLSIWTTYVIYAEAPDRPRIELTSCAHYVSFLTHWTTMGTPLQCFW